jgi:hypothetical protein
LKKEIGSEFFTPSVPTGQEPAPYEAYLLSGRTALAAILEDLAADRRVRRVLLPAYCCESMIEPFVGQGIEVQFYGVGADGMAYPYDNDADAVLLIDYFGYVDPENGEIARSAKQAGKTVIYDATHTIAGNEAVERHADYSFCSYRKWFFCHYAKAVKRGGTFVRKEPPVMHEAYMALRDRAARRKTAYLAGLPEDKETFLSEFAEAEALLEASYRGYAGVPVAYDLPAIVAVRRENAAYLMEGLKAIPEIRLWHTALRVGDTPLFVPILVEPAVRPALRRALTDARIYCPIHWPRSAYEGAESELYDRELSLVCDQRYDLTDMERMLRVIYDFFNR